MPSRKGGQLLQERGVDEERLEEGRNPPFESNFRDCEGDSSLRALCVLLLGLLARSPSHPRFSILLLPQHRLRPAPETEAWNSASLPSILSTSRLFSRHNLHQVLLRCHSVPVTLKPQSLALSHRTTDSTRIWCSQPLTTRPRTTSEWHGQVDRAFTHA